MNRITEMNKMTEIPAVPVSSVMKGFLGVPGQDDEKLKNLAKAKVYLEMARKAKRQREPMLAYKASRMAVAYAIKAKKASGKGTPVLAKGTKRGVGEIGGVWAERAQADKDRYNIALVAHQKLAKYYDDLRAAYAGARNSYSQLESRYNSLISEAGNIRTQVSARLSEYQSLITSYKESLALLDRAKSAYNQALKSYQNALNYAQTAIKEYKDQLVYYAEKVRDLAAKVGIQVGDIGEIGFTAPSLRDIVDRLSGVAEDVGKRFMSLYETALEGYNAAKAAYGKKKSQLNTYVDGFKSKVTSATNVVNSVGARVKSALTAVTEKADVVNRLKASYSTAVSTANTVTSSVGKVTAQIKAIVNKINETATNLARSAANLRTLAVTVTNSAKNAYNEAVGEAKDRAREAYERAKLAAEEAGNKIDEAKDAVADGIQASAEAMGEKAKIVAKYISAFGEDGWNSLRSKLVEFVGAYEKAKAGVARLEANSKCPEKVKRLFRGRLSHVSTMAKPLASTINKLLGKEAEISGDEGIGEIGIVPVVAVILILAIACTGYCTKLWKDVRTAETEVSTVKIESEADANALVDSIASDSLDSIDEDLDWLQEQYDNTEDPDEKEWIQDQMDDLNDQKFEIASGAIGEGIDFGDINLDDAGFPDGMLDEVTGEDGIIPDWIKGMMPEISDKTKAIAVLGGAGILALVFLPQLLSAGKFAGGFAKEQIGEASKVMKEEKKAGFLSPAVKRGLKRNR